MDPDYTDSDRDERAARFATAKGAGRSRAEPGGHRTSWGGGLSRVASTDLPPSRDDEVSVVAMSGRLVPIGYARYVAPGIDLADYEFHRVAGWDVAIPRATPTSEASDIISLIFEGGPRAAGYARQGDTLVPASLGAGDRAKLAGAARP